MCVVSVWLNERERVAESAGGAEEKVSGEAVSLAVNVQCRLKFVSE